MARLDSRDYLRPPPRRVAALPRRARRLRPRSPRPRLPRLGRRRPALAPRRGAVVLGARSIAHPARGPDEDAPGARAARRRTTGCSRPSTTYSAALVAALEAADPAEEAWTWSTEQTVGLHLPPAGARGADPPARRRAGRRQVTPLDPRAGRRRRATRPRRDVRRRARRGASSPRSPTTSGSTAPTRDESVWVQLGTLHRHRPRRPGRATTRTTSASSPDPGTRRRRRGPRPRRGPRRLAVAPRRRQRHPTSAATGRSTTTSARRSTHPIT